MTGYRLTKCAWVRDLSGYGAKQYGGRWNSKGIPLLYLASSRALAVLENLAHLGKTLPIVDFCMATVELPGLTDLPVHTVAASQLPEGWNTDPSFTHTRHLGDHFIGQAESLILRVPSVIVPDEYNFLVNVLHPDMKKVSISSVNPYHFDERLLP